jgi:hypothetical protein
MQATGNAMAAAMGEHPADAGTFGQPLHQDVNGTLYCVTAPQVQATFAARAAAMIEGAGMAGVFLIDNGAQAEPGRIVAQVHPQGVSPIAVIAAMGLTAIPAEGDPE